LERAIYAVSLSKNTAGWWPDRGAVESDYCIGEFAIHTERLSLEIPASRGIISSQEVEMSRSR
jgi:hypothetical protein